MTHTLLLRLFILTASLKLSVSLGSPLDGVTHYEVVRPARLHTIRKRNAEHSRPEIIKYGMKVGEKDIEMHLEKNNEFLTTDYSETHYLEDDTPVTTTPDIDHCYYHGRIVNDSESAVSISTCDGLRGYFKTSAQSYLIEPLSGEDEGDHAVFKYDDQKNKPMVCGVTNTTWSSDFEPPTSRSRSRASGPSLFQQQKYLELYLVADNREYLKWNKDQTELRKRIFEVVNFVNMVYKPLNTFIALVGLDIWSSRDLISVTAPAGASLNAFMTWRNSELVKRTKHDIAHLISGIDFDGATVGLAFVGTACSGHSVGVVQDHNDKAIAIGATLAHEMGHNLGMSHDANDCVCSGNSCIMSASLSWDIPRSFSSCSSNNYEQYLRSRSPGCMLDKPDYNDVVAPANCGNGFLEKGEECDCGSVEDCINPCCNATTCKLTAGSQCAAGECCEDCKILPWFRECRRRQDDCDLAEYCDGTSANCPEDVFAVNGLPCHGGRGYCYNGLCPQRADQCIGMYGPNAEVGSDSCFNQNTRGIYYAYCKRPTKDTYIPCQNEDVFCGKLFCSKGNDNPNYGRMVRFGECKATFYGDIASDRGQVDTGTKCGDGKVCSQNECMDLLAAYKSPNCSAKCPGHGVCNHRSECQCEPGWKPPYCDTEDGSGLSTEAIAGISAVAVLLVLGAIAGTVGYIWKKRQGPGLPTSAHTQRKQHALDNPTFRPNPPIQHVPVPQVVRAKPKGAPPPPPPAGNRPKPPIQSYTAARQALRPVPPPKV